RTPRSSRFPYTTLFRSHQVQRQGVAAGVLQHRSGGPQGLGLVVVGHDGRRQVQCNVLPLHSQSRGLSLMRKSSRSGSKLGFRQGSPAASSAFQRVWKRVTSETKRARFSGASSRPRLLLSQWYSMAKGVTRFWYPALRTRAQKSTSLKATTKPPSRPPTASYTSRRTIRQAPVTPYTSWA